MTSALCALLCALAGCSPADPLGSTVQAHNDGAWMHWRNKFQQRASPREVRHWEEALQEIRFEIMAQARASGSAEIETVLRSEIDQLTARAIIRRGFATRKQRLSHELTLAEGIHAANASMRTLPGDDASARVLADKVEADKRRVEKLKIELELTLGVLREYGFDMAKDGKSL